MKWWINLKQVDHGRWHWSAVSQQGEDKQGESLCRTIPECLAVAARDLLRDGGTRRDLHLSIVHWHTDAHPPTAEDDPRTWLDQGCPVVSR